MDIDKLFFDEEEKPLDRLMPNGGFFSIFRSVACIGDSLASGEYQIVRNGRTRFKDMFEYSWGQFIARSAGCKVYNFSKGGMTAKKYCTDFASSNGYWDKDKPVQAYIIALGVNDIMNEGMPLGTMDDVDMNDPELNKDTFAGWYCRIIQRYKTICPNAKFFLISMPKTKSRDKNEQRREHRDLLVDITKRFGNCYLVDLYEYMPEMDEKFHSRFFLNDHMNPCGYQLMGQVISSYIDYIIRHNIDDFAQVGLINTEYEE